MRPSGTRQANFLISQHFVDLLIFIFQKFQSWYQPKDAFGLLNTNGNLFAAIDDKHWSIIIDREDDEAYGKMVLPDNIDKKVAGGNLTEGFKLPDLCVDDAG